ncbi:MAG: efflux RND transporter periplasmic adaptor subunit [Muribaculaceae bacterium]|nr:efflux RND transporter periplasmic adaptor subunit [Muribaculaceae bacterium]
MIRFSTVLAVCITLSLACGACRKEANELVHNHNHEHEHGHEGHEDHDHEGHHHDHEGRHHEHEDHDEEKGGEPAGVITLSTEVAERFGLTTGKAERRNLSAGITVGGTVSVSDRSISVVAAPVSGVVTLAGGIAVGSEVKRGSLVATVKPGMVAGGDPLRIAKVELDAAKTEFERVEALYADRLVTISEFNAARAAYEKAKAAYSAPAASGKATAPASGVITAINVRTGEAVEAGQTILTLASDGAMTLTALLPAADYARMGMPRDARVSVPYSGQSVLLSSVGAAPASAANAVAAASGGYVPVTFSVPASVGLVPGTAVEVYLIGASASDALTIPRKAVVEQQGSHSVYVRLDDDCYLQMPVALGGTDGEYVEVLSGLDGGEDVVVDGVTAVRLASMSGSVPAGHSHSH